MPSARLTKILDYEGEKFQKIVDIETDVAIPFDPVALVSAAKAGALTTRTSATVGTLTMSGGHGIQTGDRLDIFWDTGCRYGVTVGTVATNSVPFSGGAGDNLPTLVSGTYTIQAAVPHSEAIVAAGSNIVAAAVKCPKQSVFVFTQSDGTLIKAYPILEGGVETWTSEDGSDNPFDGVTVGKVYMSHADTAAAARMNGALMYD